VRSVDIVSDSETRSILLLVAVPVALSPASEVKLSDHLSMSKQDAWGFLHQFTRCGAGERILETTEVFRFVLTSFSTRFFPPCGSLS